MRRSENEETEQSPSTKPICSAELPQSLIRANAAAETGRIEEAVRLLNDDAVEVIREMAEGDPSRVFPIYALANVLHLPPRDNPIKPAYRGEAIFSRSCVNCSA